MRKTIILLTILLLVPLIASAAGEYTQKLYDVLDRIALVLYVLGGGIALVVLLVGGVTYMTAGGNEDKIGKAKKIITNGIIGAAVVFTAGFILDLLVEFLNPLL